MIFSRGNQNVEKKLAPGQSVHYRSNRKWSGIEPGHRVEKHEREFTNYLMSIIFCGLRQISDVTRVVMTRMRWGSRKRNGRDNVGGIKVDEGGNVKMTLTEIRLIVRLIMFEDTEIRFGYRISIHYLVWAISIRNFLGSLSTVIRRKAKCFCFKLHDKASAKETDRRFS
jgi:hypothetical protein